MLSKTAVCAAILLLATCVAAQEEALGPNGQPRPEPYSFSYSADSIGAFSSHRESGDGTGRITGVYTIAGPDGRDRRVEYVADQDGYRATVTSNEPGTAPGGSGDALWQVSQPSAGQQQAAAAGPRRPQSPFGPNAASQGPQISSLPSSQPSSSSSPSSAQPQQGQQPQRIPDDSSNNPSIAQKPTSSNGKPSQQQSQQPLQQENESSDSESQGNGAQQSLVNLDDIADAPPAQPAQVIVQQPAAPIAQLPIAQGPLQIQSPNLNQQVPLQPAFWQTNQLLNPNFRGISPAPIPQVQFQPQQVQFQPQQVQLQLQPQQPQRVQLVQAPQIQLNQPSFEQVLPQAQIAPITTSPLQQPQLQQQLPQQKPNNIQQQIKGNQNINGALPQKPRLAPIGQTKNSNLNQQLPQNLGQVTPTESLFISAEPQEPVKPVQPIQNFQPVQPIQPIQPIRSSNGAIKGAGKTSISSLAAASKGQLPQPQPQQQPSFVPTQIQRVSPSLPQTQFNPLPLPVQQVQPLQLPAAQPIQPIQVPQTQFVPIQNVPAQEAEIPVPVFSFDRIKSLQPQAIVLSPQLPQSNSQQPDLIPSFNQQPIAAPQQPSALEGQQQLNAGDAQADVSNGSDAGSSLGADISGQNINANINANGESNSDNGAAGPQGNNAAKGQVELIKLNENTQAPEDNANNGNANGNDQQAQAPLEPITTAEPAPAPTPAPAQAPEQKTNSGSRLIFGKQRFGTPQGKVSGTKSAPFGTRLSA